MIFNDKRRVNPEARAGAGKSGNKGNGWLRRLWPFDELKLSTKLIVAYLLLTVIPMSLLGYFSYQQYTKSIEEQNGEYLPKLLQQAGLTIDGRIEELSALPERLASSEAVMSILRKESYQSKADYNRDQFTVNSYLARIYLEGGNPDVLGVFVLSNNRLFASARLPYTGFDAESAKIPYGQNLDLGEQTKILLPGDIGLVFEEEEPYVLLLRQLNDTENQRVLGTMLIAVDLSFIENALGHFNRSGDTVLRLQTAEGRIVYDADSARIGATDSEPANYPLRNGSFLRTGDGAASLVSVSESSAYGWLLTYSVPLKELTGRTDLVRNVTVALFIGFALITTIISILFALNVTRPLKRLSGLMRETELGRFRLAEEQELKGVEVGMLARSFNAMISRIEELIRQNVRVETNQKEAELYALQSQINPHFIYNTLETIGMAVEEGERETVVEMVTLLGRMLRFSVSNRSKFVTLEEELRNVKDYLAIQKFRFEDRFRYAIAENTGTYGRDRLYTPKFILQPIVENAIKHGLEARKLLEVTIRTELRQVPETEVEYLVITVIDNGPGIAPDRLDLLRGQLEEGETLRKADSGFGIVNVHARIKLLLGGDYGLSFESRQGEGTRVTLLLPVLNGAWPDRQA